MTYFYETEVTRMVFAVGTNLKRFSGFYNLFINNHFLSAARPVALSLMLTNIFVSHNVLQRNPWIDEAYAEKKVL